MEISKEQLTQLIPGNTYIDHWYDALSKLLPDYEINTPNRIAAFVAQCAHESANFTALHENLNYTASSLTRVWPSRFPAGVAEQYANNPEAIANRAYCSRMGNGDDASGDGWRYCGRGLIQLTGKDNYAAFADSIGITPEEVSDYVQTFEGAVQSACWFWESNNLNQYADSGDIETMTKRINGGTLGLADRKEHYEHAKHVLEA